MIDTLTHIRLETTGYVATPAHKYYEPEGQCNFDFERAAKWIGDTLEGFPSLKDYLIEAPEHIIEAASSLGKESRTLMPIPPYLPISQGPFLCDEMICMQRVGSWHGAAHHVLFWGESIDERFVRYLESYMAGKVGVSKISAQGAFIKRDPSLSAARAVLEYIRGNPQKALQFKPE